MRFCLPVLLLSALSVWAQAPATATVPQSPPAKLPADLGSVPPDTLVATVDGTKVTAADLQAILRVLPPGARQQAMKSPRQFLEQFGLLKRLSGMAQKAGLDQQSPWKEQIEYNRMVALAQAELMQAQNQVTIPEEELQKRYEADKDRYTQAKVKVIYIPFSPNAKEQKDADNKTLTEAEAKAKAERLLAEIRSGADFVKLVKENSSDPTSVAKDGDFGTIRRSDKIPDAVKNVVFSLKPGEVSEPVRQPNGFYLFRVEESNTEPFDQVKAQILKELKQQKFQQWVQTTQKSIDIKIEDEALFNPAEAAPLK
jgi:peptidyl-prolyl cis-trans isomerase C